MANPGNAPLRLLVSVKNRQEAVRVDSIGVDLLDIKDPLNGALGKASNREIENICAAVRPETRLSAALGELEECESFFKTATLPERIQFAKCGLAGTAGSNWRQRLQQVWKKLHPSCRPVAVAYADACKAQAPEPLQILECVRENGLGYLLLDTYSKLEGNLFSHLEARDVSHLITLARKSGIRVVLAGSVGIGELENIRYLGADYVGVRGAVCYNDRQGNISGERLLHFKNAVERSDRRIARSLTPVSQT